MSVVDYLLFDRWNRRFPGKACVSLKPHVFEQAISEGDMDTLILLVKKTTTESQGEKLRALVETKLKQLKKKTGLTGNTFQEVVIDYKQRYLLDLYLNDLPLLLQVLESKEESLLPQLLLQKLSSLDGELPHPDSFCIADLGKLGYLLCLGNEPNLDLELLLSRLLKGDYDDTIAFINLCLGNKYPSFIQTLYFGDLECTGRSESASFFQKVFCREQTKEVYEEAAEVYFTYLRRHLFGKVYNAEHHNDLHYFREKLGARGELGLLRTFLDRFKELIAEDSHHPASYSEITRVLDRALHP